MSKGNSKQTVQIVPWLPPVVSGVGDYATLLAKELRRSHDIQTTFLTPNVPRTRDELANDFKVVEIDRRSGALPSITSQVHSVVLHYVGYGYEKRGCPLWLLQAIKDFKKQSSIRLVIVFHELFATGAIWNSSFWLSPLQRWITKRLANLADAIVTNRLSYANTVRQFLGGATKPIEVLPVFSNVGEPPIVKEYDRREPWLIVFGGERWAEEAFTRHANKIDVACDRLNLERVIQIGSVNEYGFKSRPVEIRGIMADAEISEILSRAKAGFLNYGNKALAKSGIFAAYCAHGVVPVFPLQNHSEVDGIFHREHFLLSEDLQRSEATVAAQNVSRRVREWYVPHSLDATAHVLVELIKGRGSKWK